MRVLIATGSRHGSTREIGERLATSLEAKGVRAEVVNAGSVTDLESFQAVIVGSAVYMGHWTADARVFIDEFRGELAAIPVWVFSSGPIGDEAGSRTGIPGHDAACRTLSPRGERIFDGELDRNELNVAEKLITRLVHADEGDYHDWDAITSWGQEIADALLGDAAFKKPVSL